MRIRQLIYASIAVLIGLSPEIHAQEKIAEGDSLRIENAALRKELVAAEVRMRQLQRDLDEARSAMVQSKF